MPQSMAATHPSHLGLLSIPGFFQQYLLMLVLKVFHRHMFSRNKPVGTVMCLLRDVDLMEIIKEEYDTMEVSNCYKQVRPH